MKLSLNLGKRRPLDRPTAWACVMANQFVLPGLGSLAAGRRVGYVQLTLGLLGILPTLAFSLRLLLALLHAQQSFGSFESMDELIAFLQLRVRQLPQNWGLYFWVGLPGLFIFLVAWFWALTSSLFILTESSAAGTPGKQ